MKRSIKSQVFSGIGMALTLILALTFPLTFLFSTDSDD